MQTDHLGRQIFTEQDLINLYMLDPQRTISRAFTTKSIHIDPDLELTSAPKLTQISNAVIPKSVYDKQNQDKWLMPKEYANLDIASHVLDLCKTDAELQRAGQELIMYQERDLFPLLRYLKYLVDTMRKANQVWGVGRGSSVSSYVLYLLEVHRINSLYYDLSISDFLK
jgi:DNA polymerase III alpha subunit